MNDLITWLRAQLDEDERVARAANPWPWRRFTDRSHLDPNTIFGSSYPGDQEKLRNVCSVEYSWKRDENADHIARHDPARVLAEVEAKRRRVEVLERVVVNAANDDDFGIGLYGPEHMGADLIRLEALPFADRDGYREEWRL